MVPSGKTGSKDGSVKVCKAALDETEDQEIILRGVIDPESLQRLRIGPYQREAMPFARIKDLVEAFKTGSSVPDIDLGMRGERFVDRLDCYYLQDPVYIIDGQQRVLAAMQLIQEGGIPHLGTVVHFGTTEEWERNRFRILNAERTKLSSNVLLRNLRSELSVIELLYDLTTSQPDFVMSGRVTWNQRMKREELVTAITFLKTIGALHSHLGPGRGSNYHELAEGLQKIYGKIGRKVLSDNVAGFFDTIEQAWGIRRVTFKEGATYLRTTFLSCLALLFSRHHDFWRGNGDTKFFVEADLLRKLSLFPITDPQVANLASSGGQARKILYSLIRDHINSGKRTKRLRPRPGSEGLPNDDKEGNSE